MGRAFIGIVLSFSLLDDEGKVASEVTAGAPAVLELTGYPCCRTARAFY